MDTVLLLPVLTLIVGLAMAAWGWINDDSLRHQRGY